MHDTQLNLDIDTDFVKSVSGDGWAVGISGTPKQGAADVKTSVILHAAVEQISSNGPKSLVCENQSKSGEGVEAACHGEIAALGKFEFQVLGDAKNREVQPTVVQSVEVPEDKIWQPECGFSKQAQGKSALTFST